MFLRRSAVALLAVTVLVAAILEIGCRKVENAAKVANILMSETNHKAKGPQHRRLDWKAEDFFTDARAVALCKAIEAKNLAEIDRIVNSGVDANSKGRGNMTPLLWAFPMGEQVFKKMLDLGADPNMRGRVKGSGVFILTESEGNGNFWSCRDACESQREGMPTMC